MPKRERILRQLFPEDCILDGLRISESGRSFSIRKTAGETIIGLDLRKCANWPPCKKRTDGLFLCLSTNSRSLLVVLVELKGTDRERAMDQLNDTAETLCSKARFSQQPHNNTVFAVTHAEGHSKRVLGMVITRRSLSLRQQEQKKARGHGLTVKYRTAKSLVTSTAELRALLFG